MSRPTLLAMCVPLVFAIAACGSRSADLSPAQRTAIATEVDARVRAAYDLSQPNAEQRMLALYADTGRIVSASGGRVVASRDTLTKGIELFWENVGVNMRDPKWIWTKTYVDVLSPESAVFTGTYRVPHHTPRGDPHELAGAMTLVFEKRGSKWGVVQEHLSDLPAVQTPMDTSMHMGAMDKPK